MLCPVVRARRMGLPLLLQMFAGMLFFALVVMLIPEVDLGSGVEGHGHSHGGMVSHNVSVAPGDKQTATSRRLLTTGIIAAVGISLHNLPEGLVVYNATIGGICNEGTIDWTAPFSLLVQQLGVNCLSRGVVVTWAIALHNIPGESHVLAPGYVHSAVQVCLINARPPLLFVLCAEGMAVASPVYSSTGR